MSSSPSEINGLLAARGTRHTFRNPSDRPMRVLGIWSPGSALEFMADIGAALPASGPPDPARIAEAYRRHNSEVLPQRRTGDGETLWACTTGLGGQRTVAGR